MLGLIGAAISTPLVLGVTVDGSTSTSRAGQRATTSMVSIIPMSSWST